MLQIIKIDRKNCRDCEQNVDEKSEEEAKNTEYFKAWSRAKFMKIRRSCRFRRKTLILACKDQLRCSPERIVQSLGTPGTRRKYNSQKISLVSSFGPIYRRRPGRGLGLRGRRGRGLGLGGRSTLLGYE